MHERTVVGGIEFHRINAADGHTGDDHVAAGIESAGIGEARLKRIGVATHQGTRADAQREVGHGDETGEDKYPDDQLKFGLLLHD